MRRPRRAGSCGRASASCASTLREIRRYRPILWFLAAYWLYIDGVNTVIKMAVDYGLSLGFEAAQLLAALLLTQFVAFPAALAFGWLGSRIGARKGIFIALAVYAAATCYAYFIRNVGDFYALAVVIGLVQGGVQSLSRSYFGRLVPEGKSSEFFGFYNMMGKFAAVLGPAADRDRGEAHRRPAAVHPFDPAAVRLGRRAARHRLPPGGGGRPFVHEGRDHATDGEASRSVFAAVIPADADFSAALHVVHRRAVRRAISSSCSRVKHTSATLGAHRMRSERAARDSSQWIGFLNSEPGLDSIRDEPRFRAVSRQIGLG